MSAKDQIKQIVDYFKREPQLKDKTDGMAEGLLLGAQLADDANELSKETDASFKALQREYTENGNGSQTTAEITVARDGEQVLDDRLKRDFGNVNAQLAKTNTLLDVRGINVLHPPSPLTPCVGDGITNDTSALNAIFAYAKEHKTNVLIPETENSYLISKLGGLPGVNVYSIGKPKLDIFYDEGISDIPLLGFSSYTTYENIHFNCVEEDIEWNRGELSGRTGTRLIECEISGFRNPIKLNAWGLYLDNSHDILIDRCKFENNSQADIAIVENCSDITINAAEGSNLTLNIEPNTTDPIRNIIINGGVYSKVYLLENSLTGRSSKNIQFNGGEIKNLQYNGSNVQFNSTIIRKVTPGGPFNGAGHIELNTNLSFGTNEIIDPNMNYLTNTPNETGYWYVLNASTSNMFSRPSYAKEYLRINPVGGKDWAQVATYIPVKAKTTYLLELESRAGYPADSVWIGRQMSVSFFNSSGQIIGDYVYVHFNPSRTETQFTTERGFVETPENCTKIRVDVMNSIAASPASLDVKFVGVYEVFYNDHLIVNTLEKKDTLYVPEKPSQLFAAGTQPVYAKGQIFLNGGYLTTGDPLGWVCVQPGNPGTWVAF